MNLIALTFLWLISIHAAAGAWNNARQPLEQGERRGEWLFNSRGLLANGFLFFLHSANQES